MRSSTSNLKNIYNIYRGVPPCLNQIMNILNGYLLYKPFCLNISRDKPILADEDKNKANIVTNS